MNINPNDILGVPKHPDRIPSVERDPDYNQFATEQPPNSFLRKFGSKEVMRELKKKAPAIFHMCFPKHYADCEKFEDWRMPHLMAAASCVNALNDPEHITGYEASRNAYLTALRWMECDLPHFFIGEQMFEAIKQTNLPTDVCFHEIKFPYKCFAVSLPKGALKFRGRNIAYIQLCDTRGMVEVYDKPHLRPVELIGFTPRLILTCATTDGRWFFAPGYMWDKIHLAVDLSPEELAADAHLSSQEQGVEFKKEDAELMQFVLRTALNMLLIMDALPELVEAGHKMGIMRKGRESREMWSPNIIGKKYRFVQMSGEADKGTHASPRMHWRRGHYRRQGIGHRYRNCVCGCDGYHGHDKKSGVCFTKGCDCIQLEYLALPTFSEYKTIWIQPVLVNAV